MKIIFLIFSLVSFMHTDSYAQNNTNTTYNISDALAQAQASYQNEIAILASKPQHQDVDSLGDNSSALIAPEPPRSTDLADEASSAAAALDDGVIITADIFSQYLQAANYNEENYIKYCQIGQKCKWEFIHRTPPFFFFY